MIAIICLECRNIVEKIDPTNESSYDTRYTTELCDNCKNSIDHNSPEQKLLRAIFGEDD